jgi:hypothetical protein
MNSLAKKLRSAWLILVCLAAFNQSAGMAVETFVVRTNWSERFITNQVEVRMPRNVFVSQFFTNYTDRFHTNTVVTYLTNQFTRTLTNSLTVNQFRTNFVDHFRTNWMVRTVTNEIPVDLVETNVVALYRTNLQTLNLTNWQTVLVMTTNWVTQTLTNTMRINASETRSLAAETFKTPTVAVSETSDSDPTIQATRTLKAASGNLAEVQLIIRWPSDTADPLAVSQWRIERENGNFLSFGQEEIFKRELPFGTYQVQAKLARAADGASLVVRCTLKVGPREALVQQRSSGKKLLSSVP